MRDVMKDNMIGSLFYHELPVQGNVYVLENYLAPQIEGADVLTLQINWAYPHHDGINVCESLNTIFLVDDEISDYHGDEYDNCETARSLADHVLKVQVAVVRVVAPCSLVEVYRRFRDICCLHHQDDLAT
jgi:hypothetical protein